MIDKRFSNRSLCSVICIVLLYLFSLYIVQIGRAQEPLFDHKSIQLGRGHANTIAVSSDGNIIAVGSSFGLWLYSSDLNDVIHLDEQPIAVLTWHPSGELLAGVGPSGVSIWNTTTGKLEKKMPNYHGLGGWNIDGSLLVVQGHSNTIQVLNTKTGDIETVFSEHEDWVEPNDFAPYQNEILAIEWSPDGNHIASVDRGHIYIWNALTGNASVSIVDPHITEIAWSPNGTQLAGTNGEAGIKIWDIATGDTLSFLHADAWYITSPTWNSDGTQIAAATPYSILIWGVEQEELLRLFEPFGDQHFGYHEYRKLIWDTEKDHLVTSSIGGVRVIDAITGETLAYSHEYAGPINDIVWSPNGEYLATAYGDPGSQKNGDFQIRIWGVATKHVSNICLGHTGPVTSVDWSPDSNTLVSTGGNLYQRDGTIRLWEMTTCVPNHTIDLRTGFTLDAVWSPDGQYIAAQIWDSIAVWNADRISEEPRMLPTGPTKDIVWHPVHPWLVAGVLGNVEIYDVSDAKVFVSNEPTPQIEPVQSLSGHLELIRTSAWDYSGTFLAVGGGVFSANNPEGIPNYTIEIWDTTHSTLERTLAGHLDGITSLSWDPTGRYLASSSADHTVRIWDTITGQSLAVLEGHTDIVSAVAWSPNGTRLASGSYDGTVRIWYVDN